MRPIDAERFECIGFQATGEQRYDDGFVDGMIFMAEKIDSAPTIDVVLVVRCKDCVYGLGPDENGWYMCSNTGVGFPANGYCSDGERRNADETGND